MLKLCDVWLTCRAQQFKQPCFCFLFQGVPGAKPPVSGTPVLAANNLPAPGTSMASNPLMGGVPASYVAPPGSSPMHMLMNMMPSRLPLPGIVPASKKM